MYQLSNRAPSVKLIYSPERCNHAESWSKNSRVCCWTVLKRCCAACKVVRNPTSSKISLKGTLYCGFYRHPRESPA